MIARPRWGAFHAVQVGAFLDIVAFLDRQGVAGPKGDGVLLPVVQIANFLLARISASQRA